MRDPVEVHQRDLADALLQHADARFDQPLALLGRLVLGVLTQIAELARALDLFRQLRLQLAVELLDFVFEFLENPRLHRLHVAERRVADRRACRADRRANRDGSRLRVTITTAMERISSRQNPIVRRFRELAHARSSSGAALLDGAHLLQEALASHVPVEVVAIADAAVDADARRSPEEARRAGARVLSRHRPGARGDEPGASTVRRRRDRALPSRHARQALDGQRRRSLLILTGVQDPGNVGAIVRAAEACGATGHRR